MERHEDETSEGGMRGEVRRRERADKGECETKRDACPHGT